LLFGSIFQHFTFLLNSYLFYLVLLLKITLFNTVHSDGKKSHEIVRYDTIRWKSLTWTRKLSIQL